MKHRLEPLARIDILNRYEYYLDQASEEIAERFLTNTQASIRKLLDFPTIGAPYHCRDPRLAGLRSWPIEDFESVRLYYLTDDDSIQVIRVLHGRQDVVTILNS